MPYKLSSILSITYISHSPSRKQMTYSKEVIAEKKYLESTSRSKRNHQDMTIVQGRGTSKTREARIGVIEERHSQCFGGNVTGQSLMTKYPDGIEIHPLIFYKCPHWPCHAQPEA